MRSISKIITLIYLLVVTASYSQPVIKFQESEFDFGSIKEVNGNASHTFIFINTGNEKIIIDEVKASCGCTVISNYQKVIGPGQEGKIEILFNPKGIRGIFGKTISVKSNATNSNIDLKITGSVIPSNTSYNYNGPFFQFGNLKFSSNKLSFDTILDSKIKVDSVLLVNNWDKPMQIKIEQTPGNATFSLSTAEIPPNEHTYLVVKYDPTQKNIYGDFNERIQLETNDTLIPKKQFSIKGYVIEDFSVLTESEVKNAPALLIESTIFDFGTIKEGENAEIIFKVKNSGKNDLIFRKIKPACGCTSLNTELKNIKGGQTSELKFIFNSQGKKGSQEKSIELITNDPKNSIIKLIIKGTVSI